MRQKRVLLRFVEAVNLIDEDNRPRAVLLCPLRIGHDLLDLLNPRQHGREFNELCLGHVCDDLCECGLASPGRSPENNRARIITLDLHPQRLPRPDQMFLPDVFVQRSRTHAVRKRPRRIGRAARIRDGLKQIQSDLSPHRLTYSLSGQNACLWNQRAFPYVSERVEDLACPRRQAVYIAAYVGLWVAILTLLRIFGRFDPNEAIAAFVILGLIFPALAWISTRGKPNLCISVRRPDTESLASIGYLFVLAGVIVYGFGYVARISAEPLHSIVLLIMKLLAFVIIPATLISTLGHYTLAELMPISLKWRDLLPALWMSFAALLMQSFLGRGLHDLREAHLPALRLLFAAPLAFLWLTLEVGVVEEFFFRVLLQERLA